MPCVHGEYAPECTYEDILQADEREASKFHL